MTEGCILQDSAIVVSHKDHQGIEENENKWCNNEADHMVVGGNIDRGCGGNG